MPGSAVFDNRTRQSHPGGNLSEVDFRVHEESLKRALLSMTPMQKERLEELIQHSKIEQIFNSSQISDEQHELNKKKNRENLFKWKNERLSGALTETGDKVLTAPGVGKLLNTTRQTPHDRLKNHALFAIRDKGRMLFPVWQFDPNGPDGVVAGLPKVLKILCNKPRLTVMAWLTEPNSELWGLTPIEALREGKLESVKCEAEIVAAL